MIGVGAERDRGSAPQRATHGPESEPRSRYRVGRTGWSSLPLGDLDPRAERAYWVALTLVPGLGPVSFGRLLARFGSARRAWAAGEVLLSEVERPPSDAVLQLRRLRKAGARAVLQRVEARAAAAQGRIVTALDAGYPAALAAVDPRPPLLYVAGDDAALAGSAVAVVGTRRATGYGRSGATQIADALARAGLVVVSGLALGVDGEAHQAAVEAGGRTIAVLPSPLDRVYPPRHRGLAARIVATGGALVSELAPGQQQGRPDFARRNRIIAGLATATVIVEAPDRSGALLTAAAATAIGREVYAVPGSMDAVASRGCNRLIADHLASLVTSPVALLTSLGVRDLERGAATIATLSESEALVLAKLLKRPASVDELLGPTELATGALASALTLLEARGLVASYGGATFHPTVAARRLAGVV